MQPQRLPSPQGAPPPPSSGPSLTITDVYNVIFKHKWMILAFSLAGIAAAVGIYFALPAPYVSEAKLLVRYVEDSKAPTTSPDAPVKQAASSPEAIVTAEAELLSSLDVAAVAADIVGPGKLLGKASGSTNREAAAAIIAHGLKVEAPKRGNVLRVTYQNSDPTLVQPVLRAVIDTYKSKHVEIHKNLGVLDEFLTEETRNLRNSLTQTEEELRNLKSTNGIVSLDETRKVYFDRYAKIREELDRAEVEFNERQTALKALQKMLMLDGAQAAAQPVASATNTVAAPVEPEVKPKLSPDLIAEYRRLNTRLDSAYAREQELLKNFTEENSLVKEARTSIVGLDKQKKEMETKEPRLLEDQMAVASTSSTRGPSGPDPREIARETAREAAMRELAAENARVAALRARIETLTNQFAKVRADAGAMDSIETTYLALQRKKDLQEKQYTYYSTSLNQARVDSQLGGVKFSNISEIQSPSLPLRDSKPVQKKLAGALAGGILGGFALAFVLELFLVQTVSKPSDLENQYQIPVFLTIPDLDQNGAKNGAHANGVARAALPAPSPVGEVSEDENGQALVPISLSGEIAPWDEAHELHPYTEALRDRLVTFFEMKNMTHKPKLIALTSCSQGAGVTTLAAGLAASLSETGEGNVLLVDMNLESGAAHPFYKGKPACGLADVLEVDKRSGARVQENLYVVHGGATDERLPKVLPKRIAHLLPKLQASDYDYIIFDMPPITQTSVTPRLAGFMDMVFLVVEGEKTSREWLKQAGALLHQSKANLGAVFNKRRVYTPRWLHQEF